MKNWDELFGNLSDEEKNKIAILRVIECSNGVIQHMFRAHDEDALSIEETRDAMKFSMGCMKTMTIPLKSHTVTFQKKLPLLCVKFVNFTLVGLRMETKRIWKNL
jgi:altronate dehydratase